MTQIQSRSISDPSLSDIDFKNEMDSSPNYREYQIRLYHLVIGLNTLECNIWFWVEPHWTAKLHMLNHIKVLQSIVVEPKCKCCTLMCVNQWPNDKVECGTPIPLKYSRSFNGCQQYFFRTLIIWQRGKSQSDWNRDKTMQLYSVRSMSKNLFQFYQNCQMWKIRLLDLSKSLKRVTK